LVMLMYLIGVIFYQRLVATTALPNLKSPIYFTYPAVYLRYILKSKFGNLVGTRHV